MNFPKISRRKFIAAALLATPVAVFADAKYLEPTWLKVRRLRIGGGPVRLRNY